MIPFPSPVIACRSEQQYHVPPSHFANKTASEKVYMAAWLVLLSDSPLGSKPRRGVSKFSRQLSEDYVGTTRRLASMAITVMKCWTWSGSGLQNSLDYLEVKNTPIAKEIISLYRTPKPAVLRYVLTFLSFGKKKETDESDRELLEGEALRKWLALEQRLSNLSLPEDLGDVRIIIAELLLPYWDPVPLPIHGSGAVSHSEAHSLNEKHTDMGFSQSVCDLFGDLGYNPASYVPESSGWWSTGHCDTRSTLLFVPKDVSNVRSICMEVPVLQWAQQSIRYTLEDAIEKSPLSRFIRIKDQSYNRDAARWGSLFSHTDTIDLSSASDSVSWALVKRIFPHPMLRALSATRSKVVSLPNGTDFKLSKFAPMGSAVCFPIQSIIYCALVLREYHYMFLGKTITPSSIHSLLAIINDDGYESISGLGSVRVYGDDIVCDSRVTQSLIQTLDSLGFTVNTGKSFTMNSAFRESCGGFYLASNDVTPYILKLKSVESTLTASLLAGLLDASNRAYDYGYNRLRHFLLTAAHYYNDRKPGAIPRPLWYDPRGIKGDPVVQASIRTRSYPNTNPENTASLYQRDEGRFMVVKSRSKHEHRDDVYSYVAWQRSPYTSDEPLLVSEDSPREHELRIDWAWLPV